MGWTDANGLAIDHVTTNSVRIPVDPISRGIWTARKYQRWSAEPVRTRHGRAQEQSQIFRTHAPQTANTATTMGKEIPRSTHRVHIVGYIAHMQNQIRVLALLHLFDQIRQGQSIRDTQITEHRQFGWPRGMCRQSAEGEFRRPGLLEATFVDFWVVWMEKGRHLSFYVAKYII